jgi:hypothetical protein
VVLHFLTIWQMDKKRLITSYPLFVFYCSLQAVRLVVLYPLYGRYRTAYFFGYWAFEAFDVLVSVVIIREIYVRLFMPYEAIRRMGCALFNWAIALLLLLSWYMAVASHMPTKDLLGQAVIAFDQAAIIIRAGLILLLICIGLFFQVNWQRLNFGIAIGFFLFLMMNAAALAILLQYGLKAQPLYAELRSAGYNVGAILWAWYFIRKPVEELRPFPFTTVDLARWNADLAEMMR